MEDLLTVPIVALAYGLVVLWIVYRRPLELLHNMLRIAQELDLLELYTSAQVVNAHAWTDATQTSSRLEI
jgi:hypothetical protein